jgi:hypothetical protein
MKSNIHSIAIVVRGMARLLLVCGVALAVVAPASAAVLDFETLADLEVVTNQFSGITFQNTVAFESGVAGGSLNEFSFPPHSGNVVVVDNGGAITIHFATPMLSVGGFFTYNEGLTLRAFDSSSAEVDTAISAFSTNVNLSGNPPNEFLELASALGIVEVTIIGNVAGASFTLDDLTFEPAQSVPEPATLALLGVGVGFMACRRRKIAAVAA